VRGLGTNQLAGFRAGEVHNEKVEDDRQHAAEYRMMANRTLQTRTC
jgi:hypothetical protein